MTDRQLALITGASTGIGRSLGEMAARDGYDVLLVSDEPVIEHPMDLTATRVDVTTLCADLSTSGGRDMVMQALGGRVPAICAANAGRGLGNAFVDQSPKDILGLLDINVIGTTMLVHRIAGDMARRGSGRILLTGSIVGEAPGPYQAVYNASKAYVNQLAPGLRDELGRRGVSVTCLLPGATRTRLFKRARLETSWLGRGPKSDPDKVARLAWRALLRGRAKIVPSLHNKAAMTIFSLLPDTLLARLHRALARPRP
ncbi:SDR family oxidoreductase [Paracoccus nototheniae]|uniref:SDR family NAD(P)-dependent oxidoreductase n=1 Tax=Paracoccus nototheniae TaxID=2489002 RepID=A0ABW4DXL5_9RHOB|nr:SDR family NAD(P)-dependent oxidoreductase [Paracoccus nototheniae]